MMTFRSLITAISLFISPIAMSASERPNVVLVLMDKTMIAIVLNAGAGADG